MPSNWAAVPDMVASFCKLAAAPVAALRAALPDGRYRAAYWHAGRNLLYVQDGDYGADWAAVAKAAAASLVVDGYDEPPPGLADGDEPWVLVKRADPVTSTIAGAMNLVPTPINETFGGPTPLAAILSGGALGAAAGYGTGWALEQLVGRRVLEKGKLRKMLALAGGGLGAAPGLWGWGVSAREQPDVSTMGALVSNWPYVDDAMRKGSALVDASPSIPRNRFGQLVMADQDTPLPIRSAVTGLLAAASQVGGGSAWVSPSDVARVAVGMGSGYASGLIVGKTLGALAGLSADAQASLRRAGTWAGVLTAVVPMAFGRG